MDLYILGAGLAIGIAGIGVGIGEGLVGRSALICMSKNESMIGTFLVFTILGIALTESAAIYGLIVSFNIMGIDITNVTMDAYKTIAGGLAVGLGGVGAGVGEGMLIGSALEAMLRNPSIKGKIITYMVLFVALIEAVAIYGLIIAMQLMP